MAKKRYSTSILDSRYGCQWRDDVITYYVADHTMEETYEHVRHTYPITLKMIRQLLNEVGVNRGVSGAQKLKRFSCNCLLCCKQFQGRTPTACICDECVIAGDDRTDVNSIGVPKARLRKYGYAKRMSSYGIDVKTYESMLNECNSCCGICGRYTKRLCIDHDHVTGKIRGLLCNRCNLTLGAIELLQCDEWFDRAKSWCSRDALQELYSNNIMGQREA